MSSYSTVVGGVPTPTLNKGKDFIEYVVKMSVELLSSNLWQSPYSPYQKQLYDLICRFHDGDGWNFKQISDWLIGQGYLTPRGKTFTHTHVWSIYAKKNRSIQRFARRFPHRITDLKVESADYWVPQPELMAV